MHEQMKQTEISVTSPETLRDLVRDMGILRRVVESPGPFDTASILSLSTLSFSEEIRTALLNEFYGLPEAERVRLLGQIGTT